LLATSGKTAPEFGAGAAGGGGDTAAAFGGEVWTVDKPNARLGADGRFPQDQSSLDCPIRDRFIIAATAGQGTTALAAYFEAVRGVIRAVSLVSEYSPAAEACYRAG
jgi:hypothetical protein